MEEQREIEVDERLLDVAHALCDNIINYYIDGEGPDFHFMSALCAVATLAGEKVFFAVHDVPAMQKKLYDELYVLSDRANALIFEESDAITVSDYIVGLAGQAGATDDDFPDLDDVIEKTLDAMTEGRLMPELPLDKSDYPLELPLGFCADMRDQLDVFFREHDVTDPLTQVTVLGMATGAMIQAIADRQIYDMANLLEIAFLNLNFSSKVIPLKPDYKRKLGLDTP